MKFSAALILSIALSSTANALVPRVELVVRDIDATVQQLEVREAESTFGAPEELWKRKGGGGGGGRGGSSGGSSSGGTSSGGTSSGGTSSGGTSSGGRAGGLGSSSSSTGGSTTTGSGPKPAYGGGSYYGGGGAVPYTSGGASRGGISPVLLGVGVGVGAGALTYGLLGGWHGGRIYSYPYKNSWTFYNITVNANQTKPVQCLCEEYNECGCDDNENAQYQKDILGNGSYAALNKTLVTVADINSKSTIILNGTLPNGTTAAGGTEDADGTSTATTGDSFSLTHGMMRSGVYWVMAAVVGSAVFLV
ncbi:hypothetical protein VE03_00558 [Pseudogymnoascus sp. 23342-1-I1]|nr:hypothetical protein VE03_00558 [Pseudogymnoascus sp. 23342-1-I1]